LLIGRLHVTFIVIERSMHHGQPYVLIMVNGHMTVYRYNDNPNNDGPEDEMSHSGCALM